MSCNSANRHKRNRPSINVPISIGFGVILDGCRFGDEVEQLKSATMFVSKVDEVDFAHGEYDEDDLPAYVGASTKVWFSGIGASEFQCQRVWLREGRLTHILRGWKDAERMGASKRMVVTRRGGSVSDARSQMTIFQSFEAVRT